MNLAHQTVLEGLNAILDHRKTVYIPELDQEFKCHPDFCIFACQNPIEHGIGRKNLPKSFLNRFTKIYLEDLNDENYFSILKCKYGDYCSDEEFRSLIKMTHELETILENDKLENSVEYFSSTSSNFNLRDLSRFFQLYTSPLHSSLSKEDRLFRAFELNSAKLISNNSFLNSIKTLSAHTSLSFTQNSSFFLKSTQTHLNFYTSSILSSVPVLSLPKLNSTYSLPQLSFHSCTLII
jgi:MoxR-like ATPase